MGVLCTAEGGAAVAVAELAGLVRRLCPGAKLLLEKGEVRHLLGGDGFTVKGFSDPQKMAALADREPKIYVSADMKEIYDSISRESSGLKVTVKPTGDPNLLEVTSMQTEDYINIGGPDCLIGPPREKARRMREALAGGRVRLLVVKGGAGKGKTRIIRDSLENAIKCRMALPYRNTPHKGIVQLIASIAKKSYDANLAEDPAAQRIRAFLEKP
ncbi:hypothetical protein HYV58_01770, partial [Candidatus Peregrinibacteria bacterium]|nr:hypothetical protein [Candidatus Peregrinibacteria bacterium]